MDFRSNLMMFRSRQSKLITNKRFVGVDNCGTSGTSCCTFCQMLIPYFIIIGTCYFVSGVNRAKGGTALSISERREKGREEDL